MNRLKIKLQQMLVTLLLFISATAGADDIRYMRHAEESLASFLHIIETAKQSISLTTFIFEPCHASTQVLMDALVKKARSGVKVQILLDAFMHSGKQTKELASFFHDNRIEIRWFSPSLLTINHRSHIKLVVADGKRYITGGRNIADEYFSLYDGANFIDRDAYVSGASAKQAQLAFDNMWNSKLTKVKNGTPGSFARWSQVCAVNEDKRVEDIQASLARRSKALLANMPVRSCAQTEFVVDEPGAKIMTVHDDGILTADRAKKHVTSEFLKFIKGTKKKLIMENWTFMPHNVMGYAFFDMTFKKIPVLVLTNDNMDGPGLLKYAEDSFHARAVKLRNRGTMIIQKVSMHGSMRDDWALSPKKALYRMHGKVGTRDNKDVFVSSANIDYRSYGLNMESMVLVKNCPALVKDVNNEVLALARFHEEDIKNGVEKNDNDNLFHTILGMLSYSFL